MILRSRKGGFFYDTGNFVPYIIRPSGRMRILFYYHKKGRNRI